MVKLADHVSADLGCVLQARLTLAKFLLWVAPAGAAIAIVSEILSLATHFTLKSDLIEQCVTIETERKIPGYEISETKARNCKWQRPALLGRSIQVV